MNNRTKIVCTIGPAVNCEEKIEALIQAGMSVARLNFSHGTYEEHAKTIRILKSVREKLQVPLAIMLDTKGPEIRLGTLKNHKVILNEGQKLWLVKEEVEGNESQISLKPGSVLSVLKVGMSVLLNDGYIRTEVVAVESRGVQIEVKNGGVIQSTKGVNIPEVDTHLLSLTEKDVEDIKFGCEKDVDLVAASFIRSEADVVAIKKLLHESGCPDIRVIAKIESRQGVENFESIVQVADGIMVARGDLGVELPLTKVPRLQKMMIQKSFLAGKPSVTATQMLESMIVNPRPTRAEASDVANAIYDSTSAVMLSGETAVGSYPIESVNMMEAIIEETERDFDYFAFFKQSSEKVFPDVPSSVATACINTAYQANAQAIFAFTSSGSTARLLSRLRPVQPIIALTPNIKVFHQLSLSWGITPLLYDEADNIEEAYAFISKFALEQGLVSYGDLVVITAGTPFGRPGTTNMMIVGSIDKEHKV